MERAIWRRRDGSGLISTYRDDVMRRDKQLQGCELSTVELVELSHLCGNATPRPVYLGLFQLVD